MNIKKLQTPDDIIQGFHRRSIGESIMHSVVDVPMQSAERRWEALREERLFKQRGATPLEKYQHFTLEELSQMFD